MFKNLRYISPIIKYDNMGVYLWKELFEILLYLFVIKGNFNKNFKSTYRNGGTTSGYDYR